MLKMLAMETVCSYVIPTVDHMILNNSNSKGFPDNMNISNVKINDKNIIVDKISEYFGNIGNTMSNTIYIKNKD